MKFSSVRSVITAAAFLMASGAILAQEINFTASINAAQENPATGSAATGFADLEYNGEDNTFDLAITLNNFPNTITASHIHEGVAGVNGGAVNSLGDETVYTRSGDTLTLEVNDVPYSGDPAVLLAGGAYLNFHTAEFPSGEIRGQLIGETIKLYALMTPEQETASVTSDAYGAARINYNPSENKMEMLVFIYNFANTLTGSHIHAAAVGQDGGVVNSLGAAADYNNWGGTYSQYWDDVDFNGDPVALLSGGTYINVHSDVNAPGEIRGQIWMMDDEEEGPTRLVNVSSRGNVGLGDNAMITGFVVTGRAPMLVLSTGRGPVLTDFGVAGALADPQNTVFANGVALASNDNFGDDPYAQFISQQSFAPTVAAEAAVFVLLPPGAYTNVVSGVGDTTGVALAESFEVEF